MSVELYIENSYKISELVTQKYSTSFSLATSLLDEEQRKAIYAIYGFVRLADEIVDSFHGFDKLHLLMKLHEDLDYALLNGISTNTIISAFAHTVKKYQIDQNHIYAFMKSMENDISISEYTSPAELDDYIFGSADVVGLMCLKVFCNGSHDLFDHLKYPAQKLGSAFQKVNFLRDLTEDVNILERTYFPEMQNGEFNDEVKKKIEQSIEDDFKAAIYGIKNLPGRSKLAVAIAFHYYSALFKKIKRSSPSKLLSSRIRIPNIQKYLIIIQVFVRYKTKSI